MLSGFDSNAHFKGFMEQMDIMREDMATRKNYEPARGCLGQVKLASLPWLYWVLLIRLCCCGLRSMS